MSTTGERKGGKKNLFTGDYMVTLRCHAPVREVEDKASHQVTRESPISTTLICRLKDTCGRNIVGACVRRTCSVTGKKIKKLINYPYTLVPSNIYEEPEGASIVIPPVRAMVFCRLEGLILLIYCATNL